ncbi:MAG: hypothetical protein DI562_18575 [Stenotrophomonas acidaminiphila]|jgi:uncharacterized protein (DUF2141 family)|uniref:DUF2141 domain-containing protein n=1 Tax=Pseudoxanthomonas japonensis TaxID=69284 RepID=UPI000DB1E572|nr:DUF2141 domain-containing protein [Pseudoxanthomonas sp.]NCT72673.1 DUF2141 domain-containing protein [Xanthomonadaceae bacterium]PZQ23724.1 MAG: hypothetical protein DI562_18575 [Stenotrophomonas acidaminiphila]
MSRPRHYTLPLSLVLACCAALPAWAADLTVTLHDVRAQTGLLKLAVVDSQAGWDGQAKPIQADGAPPQGNVATFVFKDLQPGAYAVLVTHDENGNGTLDSNMIGMPVEAYGFSNNPNVMRKPTWDEARFEVGAQDAAIDITLR